MAGRKQSHKNVLAETTDNFKRLCFDRFTQEISKDDVKQVPIQHYMKWTPKMQAKLPMWFQTHGRSMGAGLLPIGGFIAFAGLMFFHHSIWFLFGFVLMVLGLVAVVAGGARDYAGYRKQLLAEDSPKVLYAYGDRHSEIRDDNADVFMTPKVPEYRLGDVADKFYVDNRLVVNDKTFEAGSWHYGVETEDDDGHKTTSWSQTGYGLYDMQTKLPTVRFRLKGAIVQRPHLNVSSAEINVTKKITLKAGFDEHIVTTVKNLDDKALIVDLFTDDVLATIYDLFNQYKNLTEIECDHSQIVCLWKAKFDDLNTAKALNNGQVYTYIFDAMHEVVRQIGENLDNRA